MTDMGDFWAYMFLAFTAGFLVGGELTYRFGKRRP